MNVDQKITKRLQDLIELGNQVLATKRDPPRNCIGFDAFVDSQLASRWTAQSQNLLIRVFGESSPHYTNFTKHTKQITFGPARRMLGTLEAALSDFQEGYLFDVKRLITGDVFSDILDQSQHLLHSGYHQAAMVLGGAVLEDTLRSLCSRHDIDTPSKPKLDKMNADLAKAGCYTKLVQKRITGIADVRNSAAHGKWDEFSEDDVRDALSWIVRFVGDNCG